MSPKRLTMPRNPMNRMARHRGRTPLAASAVFAVASASVMSFAELLPCETGPPERPIVKRTAPAYGRSHQLYSGCGEPHALRAKRMGAASRINRFPLDQGEYPAGRHNLEGQRLRAGRAGQARS